jgi:hypothetical protein
MMWRLFHPKERMVAPFEGDFRLQSGFGEPMRFVNGVPMRLS